MVNQAAEQPQTSKTQSAAPDTDVFVSANRPEAESELDSLRMPELSAFDIGPTSGSPVDLALDILIRASDSDSPAVRNAMVFLGENLFTEREVLRKLNTALEQRLEEAPDEPLPVRFTLLSELLGNLRLKDTEKSLCDRALQQYKAGAPGTAVLEALHAFNSMESRRTIEKLANGTVYRDRFLDRFQPDFDSFLVERLPFWSTYFTLRIFQIFIEQIPAVHSLSRGPQILTSWGGAVAATLVTVLGASFAIAGVKSLFTTNWRQPIYNGKMSADSRKLWDQILKSETPASDARSASGIDQSL
ncbi:MAG: hypothetical protein K1X83_03710 [Oligoflexia bacterium]|nr:hypothetical protein [Oligoflexia bacterium]